MAWETVRTIDVWWDRPRLGVADVAGVPHIYESPFVTELDDFADFYLLSPIDPQTLELILEDWGIWTKWADAFDRGEVHQDTHPALPKDRRHDTAEQLIGNRAAMNPTNCRRMTAKFRRVAPGWNGYEVEWTDCSTDQ
jgi:hypothetical protein